jgi:hypothetical protein
MNMRSTLLVGSLCLTVASALVWAHEDSASDGSKADNKHLLHDTPNPDGHIPSNVNYGFTVVGHDALGGISDGKYTDVWAYDGYAYVGTFEEPTCDRSGVFISDIRDPANPTTIGMIKSPPNTRINDVKVHRVGNKTVLIHSLEPCGPLKGNGQAVGGGNGGKQQGQGGISLWDVTDPTMPHALKQNFLDTPVHNTFAWTTGAGKTFLMIVDDINVDDVIIADITKPQAPKKSRPPASEPGWRPIQKWKPMVNYLPVSSLPLCCTISGSTIWTRVRVKTGMRCYPTGTPDLSFLM